MKGIDSLGFKISDPESINDENFKILLNRINPECAELNFSSNGKAREIVTFLAKISEANGFDLSQIRGAVEADPIGRLMINGTLCIPVEAGFDYLAILTEEVKVLPKYRSFQVNGSNFTNAGSDSVQELGYTIAMAVEYLSKLTDRGIAPGEVAKRMRFSFGTGSSYFIEIAKLRAARILWQIVANAYKAVEKDPWRMEIHCTTSSWNATIYDPYVNMLRTQTEAMSAILGGTDSLTVNPFDSAFRDAGEFSERIARNQQLILKEEAYFNKVADPSSGSYYIENLTALIAENSWKLFLEVEELGGFISALRSGFIQKKVSETAARRKNNIASRKEILTGTNQYPEFSEKIESELSPLTAPVNSSDNIDAEVEPVRLSRGSEKIEKVRIAVDNAARRPVVFMLKIGNHAMGKARAQFSAGFFGCAGYRIIENENYVNVNEAAKAALDTGSDIVVICSSDDEYTLYAPAIFDKLAGKAIVVIAGKPENIESLKSKGLENFIDTRSNLTDTLKFYNSKLGLKQNL
jgi:methylmalonyl-CoA mutase